MTPFTLALSALMTATPPGEPPALDQLFFNARLASREGRPRDVLTLWLIRNTLHARGERGGVDDDFRSLVWDALGETGVCPDGFPEDDGEGAGLWPLALHNWLVKNLGKAPPPGRPSSWDVFAIDRQQRPFSLHDVLSAEELEALRYDPGFCLAPYLATARTVAPGWPNLEDRLATGHLLRRLLERSRDTLNKGEVKNLALIEVRLFDLDLALIELEARRARQRASELASTASGLGLPDRVVDTLRERLSRTRAPSPRVAFLRRTLTWQVDEWLSLTRERRLALFQQAKAVADEEVPATPLVLALIDALAARGEGDEVESWIGHLALQEDTLARRALYEGDRGERLLSLEPGRGFQERPVIALHRGVSFLEQGQRHEALRSFAWALGHAEESRAGDAVHPLARRWLAYVLSFYETSAEVIATLEALVPTRDYNEIIEELLWRAAVRADPSSFERAADKVRRGGALDLRIAALAPLAAGDAGKMAAALLARGEEEAFAVFTFLDRLLAVLEGESAEVRRANTPTLQLVLEVIERLRAGDERARSRRAGALVQRASALLDGLFALQESEALRARASAPSRSAFAGSVRLAPSDPLPWPFSPPNVKAPSAFSPIALEPVEWRDERGALVFGWRLSE